MSKQVYIKAVKQYRSYLCMYEVRDADGTLYARFQSTSYKEAVAWFKSAVDKVAYDMYDIRIVR